jgi:acetyltransferase
MTPMLALMKPRGIAVIGASQRANRATGVLNNLKKIGYAGAIFGVNPNYREVMGHPCVPSVRDLPADIDCVVAAVAADAACDSLEAALEHGIRSAVVLAAGFGEGGKGGLRAERLRGLAARGMCICGPNCFGVLNVKDGVAAFSGTLPPVLKKGGVALVSQSGGLAGNAFFPLMDDRQVGFSHVISCGNQIGASIEDYIEYFVQDDDVRIIAAIVESLRDPRKLLQVSRQAHARGKSLIVLQTGRSAAGRIMVHSHTGALVENSDILAAFLRRCGIVQVDSYDEFVEAIELFAHVPSETQVDNEVIVIAGSGGNAAIAADTLEEVGLPLATLSAETRDKIASSIPDFASITNPIDGTGALYDDETLLPKILDAVFAAPGRPIVTANVSVRASLGRAHRFARIFSDTARSLGRSIVAYQYSHLGGPLDKDIVDTLHDGNIPVLMGTQNAMRALRYLPLRCRLEARAREASRARSEFFDRTAGQTKPGKAEWDFLAARKRLGDCGVPVAEAMLAQSEGEAVEAQRRYGAPVAIKIEAPGLLHKSDIGCVRVNCRTADEVADAYRAVMANAKRASVAAIGGALVQPMAEGVAEAYAGILNDSLFGPTVSVGLGGIFIEILHSAETEMAPLDQDLAMQMIARLKGIKALQGARGRPAADIEALARLLVNLSRFAVEHFGQFKTLELNPIILGKAGEGAIAVDIAVEQ